LLLLLVLPLIFMLLIMLLLLLMLKEGELFRRLQALFINLLKPTGYVMHQQFNIQ
jgi:hypothetical protein